LLRPSGSAVRSHRGLKPQREIFDVLAHRPNSLIPEDARLYFRDVYDHVLRITDSLESYGELMSATTDSYVAHVSMRLNRAANTFSAIATIAIPFIVISSLYGMNFIWMPLTKEPAGFWIIIAVRQSSAWSCFSSFADVICCDSCHRGTPVTVNTLSSIPGLTGPSRVGRATNSTQFRSVANTHRWPRA
jgi:Mg2+ and Co2+ transporter CorA